MIKINNLPKTAPYEKLQKYYLEAQKKNQKSIEAICISSLDHENLLVDSRYVNLKYIDGEIWTFFSNYNSPKALQFDSHSQISSVIFWNKINLQIRLKAHISKSASKISDEHFSKRNKTKNALAISSYQSEEINSYSEIVDNYNKVLEKSDLKKRPSYWGGYSFIPFYFEFWKGHKNRLNKRTAYIKKNGEWNSKLLQP
tara:strand:- start:495 stop:1091 length:597 start_codon:yes stop_codon:yes gene_type:complete